MYRIGCRVCVYVCMYVCMYVCPFFMAHFTVTAYSSCLLSVCLCLGQVDLQMATEGADSVLVSVTCDGHVTVTHIVIM